MPTPPQARLNVPIRTPQTPVDQALNWNALEEVIDRFPVFPEYMTKKLVSALTVTGTGFKDGPDIKLRINKTQKWTDLIVRLSGAAKVTSAPCNLRFLVKLTNTINGSVITVGDYIAHLNLDAATGARYHTSGMTRIPNIPEGKYIVSLVWTVSPASSGAAVDAGCLYYLSVTEAIPIPPAF